MDESQQALMERYLDLLFAANERMNLTRITDRATAQVQHIADSLTVLPYLPGGTFKLVDVGSGGGVPGIPLAIARPDAKVILIEATKKKAVFLRQTVEALALKNVHVLGERVEDIGQGVERENFDVAVMRAVASLAWLAEWCLPLLKTGGKLLAMKGQKIAEELPEAAFAIRRVGGGEPVVHPVALEGTEHRVIVEILKVQKSDAVFPRAASVAKGRPLM